MVNDWMGIIVCARLELPGRNAHVHAHVGRVRVRGAAQGDHFACAKPPVDMYFNFTSMSTGGFAQAEWSPCSSARETKS